MTHRILILMLIACGCAFLPLSGCIHGNAHHHDRGASIFKGDVDAALKRWEAEGEAAAWHKD